MAAKVGVIGAGGMLLYCAAGFRQPEVKQSAAAGKSSMLNSNCRARSELHTMKASIASGTIAN